jgi:gamma-glutamyl:cysteine ligase YbdK (ATP-grasp superfamily)
MNLTNVQEAMIVRASEALTTAINEADDSGWDSKSTDLVHYAEDVAKDALLILAGQILAERRKEAERPKITVDDDGLLTCACGNHGFKENGSHPCDWGFERQDPDEKRLVLFGEFEWYDGSFGSYECTACGLTYDALPEGWKTDYA